MNPLTDLPKFLLVRDFDFESKPLWFWWDKPTAVITSLSYMDSVGGTIDHDSMTTTIAPLRTPEAYMNWLQGVWNTLVGCDILTGHNIDRFDLPLMQGQLLKFGMDGLPSLTTQDTMRLPKRRDMSISQESLTNYAGLKAECPIGMPIYKHHLSIPEWERAAMGWDDTVLEERPSSDVHAHAHIREVLIEKGYLGAPEDMEAITVKLTFRRTHPSVTQLHYIDLFRFNSTGYYGVRGLALRLGPVCIGVYVR